MRTSPVNDGVVDMTHLSIRQMQFLAASCLAEYCERIGFRDSAIAALLRHQVSMSTANDLGAWDLKGAHLEVTGRGDPLPERLQSCLPPEVASALSGLIETSVEVGIHDLYGARTDQPQRFLASCIGFIEQAGLSSPPMEVPGADSAKNGWGESVSIEEVERVLAFHPALALQMKIT